MPQEARELVCMITRGTDHELSSVGFTIANGGITAGLKVFIFLSSSGVDLIAGSNNETSSSSSIGSMIPARELLHDDAGGSHKRTFVVTLVVRCLHWKPGEFNRAANSRSVKMFTSAYPVRDIKLGTINMIRHKRRV